LLISEGGSALFTSHPDQHRAVQSEILRG